MIAQGFDDGVEVIERRVLHHAHQVERHVGVGQRAELGHERRRERVPDEAFLLELRRFHRAALRPRERVVERADELIPAPGTGFLGRDGKQQRLRRYGVGLVEAEGDAGVLAWRSESPPSTHRAADRAAARPAETRRAPCAVIDSVSREMPNGFLGSSDRADRVPETPRPASCPDDDGAPAPGRSAKRHVVERVGKRAHDLPGVHPRAHPRQALEPFVHDGLLGVAGNSGNGVSQQLRTRGVGDGQVHLVVTRERG